MNLNGISCREESITALKENPANPEQLEELEIWSDIESLDSLGITDYSVLI